MRQGAATKRVIGATALLLTLGAFSACGKDETKKSSGGAAQQGMNGMTFADEASLPACDATKAGVLAYVTATKTFRSCDGTAWTVIDLKGEKGADGADGANDATLAIALYKKYKRSVFRAVLTCSGAKGGAPARCRDENNNVPDPGISMGSAFLCAEGTVCTNAHVAVCDTACYTNFDSLEFQALGTTSDSLPDGAETAPFATVTSASALKQSGDANVDLAKVTVTGVPSGIEPLPLATKAATATVTAMQSVLSMSYPLGFIDLYVDVGAVNTPAIGECTENGIPGSVYGCPKDYYAFSTTNDTDHGSSGSPLFDLKTGLVIGVTSAGTDGENANYTWAVDAFKLRDID